MEQQPGLCSKSNESEWPGLHKTELVFLNFDFN